MLKRRSSIFLAAVILPMASQGLFATAQARADESDKLVNPSTDVPPEWLTKAERTEFRETPRYDETVAYCKRLADASDWIDMQSYGTSPEGRDMPLLVVSRDRLFTPEAARASDHAIIFVQNGIHAGECEGKDASLMLVRDMAVTKTRADLLEKVVLIVIPIFNLHRRLRT